MLSPVIQPSTFEHQHALESLGLTSDFLTEIGTRILGAYHQATPHDALSAPGLYAYLAAVRALRDVLCPQGWASFRRHNIEMVAPPSRQIAVLPSSGDKYTGLDGIEPKTKNKKGNKVQEIITINRNQPYLFPEFEPVDIPSDPTQIQTWVLLYHVDSRLSEMRMELALPVHIDLSDLKVDSWKTRIKLPAIKFDHRPTPFSPEPAPEFDIEIRRKSNE